MSSTIAVPAVTVPAIAARSVVPTVAIVTRSAALHHRARPRNERVDANGHVPQNILVDPHLAFHFVDRRGRRLDVEEDIVTLAVFSDAVGECSQPPIFAVFHTATAIREHLGELVG